MTLKCHSTTWIVALSTWKKFYFRLVKKQKMTSKYHSITWIIAFPTSQNRFLPCLEVGNEFAVPGNLLEHRFLLLTKAAFLLVKRLKMSSECLATTWNIVFSTSPKSHFVMAKTPKMNSKWHASPWNIAHSNSTNSNLRLVKRLKIISRAFQLLETSLYTNSLKSHFGLAKRKKMSSLCLASTWIIAFSTSTIRILDLSRGRKWLLSAIRLLES